MVDIDTMIEDLIIQSGLTRQEAILAVVNWARTQLEHNAGLLNDAEELT